MGNAFQSKAPTISADSKNNKEFPKFYKTLTETHQSGVRADSIPLSADNNPFDYPLF